MESTKAGGSDSESSSDAQSPFSSEPVPEQTGTNVENCATESNANNKRGEPYDDSDDDWYDNEDTLIKLEEGNVVVGCYKSSTQFNRNEAIDYFQRQLAKMSSDPKYWKVDECDMLPLKRTTPATFRIYCPAPFADGRVTNIITVLVDPAAFVVNLGTTTENAQTGRSFSI
ncbi:unnamed protein product [Hydatigera taeniaeformis]|uniref:RanBD1 domain-containing protein n=1 Tax=Hydatigena taeniaeformis TaxID=6205 RepID=A0A0R3X0B3_HYDTA|nr:unnamed protein product [Hydatigera taeniaeformis]